MAEPEGIWETLRQRLDYASFVPRLVPDLVRSDLRTRAGEPYVVIKNPHGDKGAGTYLRLEAADAALLELMDGKRTMQEILVEHLERTGSFALDRLARLTSALRMNGFFGEEPPLVYEKLRARRRPLLDRLSLLMRRLILWDVARWENAEAVVDVVYRLGGRLFFTRLGALVAVAFSAYGLWLWAQEVRAPRHDLVSQDGSYTLGILILVVLQVISISVHEAGHALAIRHYGRRVRRLGFAIYYLFPCFYVDATDMTLASRRERVVVSLAGPVGGLLTAAVCAVVTATAGDSLAASLAFKAASLFVFQFFLNLLPILDLDGYNILVDALDIPLLRQRAVGFVRGRAIRKIRRREKWTRGEVGLAAFGGSAILISFLMLFIALWLWQTRVQAATSELVAIGPVGLLGLALIVLVFVGPLLVALAGRVLGLGRVATRSFTSRRRKAKQLEMEERITTLGRIRFLNGLPRTALAAIASHLEVHDVEAGEAVFSAGDVGDRFYIVRSGRVEAVSPEGQVLNVIIPGEGFGELALLDRATRSATVRATEPTVLWSLDRGHFERWVAERYEIAARIRASREERDRLVRLPFFSGLSRQQLERILPRMRTVRASAGEEVVRAGEPGDRYFVIHTGTARVTLPDGTHVRDLGPGDGFGELALLFGGPRTATVTATSDMTLGALGRRDFAELVKQSGETAGTFRRRTAHYVGAGIGATVARGS
ncbi:MAG TPA: cyclic nucleotide-binding domain-containing protein [Candidatus Limnocylindria bacterium]|nr:cyclic nucleotide-binding domain-containing protein [Candidatus Limnocylindria bacterium]